MMHLTHLRYTRPIVRDTQAIHRTVMHALDGTPSGRVLWCVPDARTLIVQANAPVPDSIGGATVVGTGPVRTRFEPGDRVQVALIANPTRAISTGHTTRGTVRPVPIGDCADWLARKTAGALDLRDVEVEELGARTGARHNMRVTHRLVGYAATATVTDSDALKHLITHGVGRGKAYGAGLLLVNAL